jgi:AAA15 family ATPase/GTPase
MKIQTLEINNFRGLKKFKIENLPNFVVLTDESAAGKSSILRAITYLKENIISPDRQPKTCTSSDSQCHELVNNNSSTCEISAKFELNQLETDYLRR